MNERIKLLNQLGFLAIAEGISYLLLFVTMYMKYYLDNGTPNKIIGMIHGVLFIAYCAWTLYIARKFKWPFKVTFVVLAASLLPFATFYVEKLILKPLKSVN